MVVELFNQAIVLWVVSCGVVTLKAKMLGKLMPQLSYKLDTSIQHYCVWNAKPHDPIMKEDLCAGCHCTVYHGNCLGPMHEIANYCKEVCLAF